MIETLGTATLMAAVDDLQLIDIKFREGDHLCEPLYPTLFDYDRAPQGVRFEPGVRILTPVRQLQFQFQLFQPDEGAVVEFLVDNDGHPMVESVADPSGGPIHGLTAAVENLAARSALPVTVDVRLPHRLPLSVETAAYFVVAEALTNAVKHSKATGAEVRARLHTDVLTLSVSDDGIGGAEPSAGTGLVGLADRIATADGRFRVSSPQGGPTLLHVELPCR